MKARSMSGLMERVVGEWAARSSIFDIPGTLVRRVLDLEAASPGFTVGELRLALPIGPAAGPHTQIASNIIAAWLAGGRVFELKTVQEKDALDIEKPCIDALDEGQNVEWSTELTLEDARSEYLRAWIALGVLGAALSAKAGKVLFNLSVGYTLSGIKSAKMDAFIEGMLRPVGTEVWERALAEARAAAASPSFARAFGRNGAERAAAALETLSADPVHSATISTMHGCPPEEIERIGAHLIREKGADTYIKLNPTLLGYDRARGILDTCGWERISLKRDSFDHDLRFSAALDLIASLGGTAAASGRRLGIKLSNTLANGNDGVRLPGPERYMSGRPLFPVTTALAAELAVALSRSGDRPPAFSYCGGVSGRNAAACLGAGLGPLTVVTEILKPGGYLRLEALGRESVRALAAGVPASPDPEKLAALAARALSDAAYRGDYKAGEARIPKPLPETDCFAAPCVEACPAGQRAPDYMGALGCGDAARSLSIIYQDNPLPRITGVLCDHRCMEVCSRVDYEGPVLIRGMKLAASRAVELPTAPAPRRTGVGSAAVIGAGPAGLSCAHYLALEGYPVTVFDSAAQAGGVPANTIPPFRISREDLAHDIGRIRRLGAEFRLGAEGRVDPSALPTALRSEGYSAIVLACGAPVPRPIRLEGAGIPVTDALAFLAAGGGDAAPGELRSVVVVGGGNTAMDAARVAARLPGKPRVTILYRRSRAEMPADVEEFEAALADGVRYEELSLPEAMVPAAQGGRNVLRVREMALGPLDASGRRSPVPTENTRELPCDLVVQAVGESPDVRLFAGLGIEFGADGLPTADGVTMETGVPGIYVVGDCRRGPSSIIAAEADGRAAAYAILRKAGIEPRIDAAPRAQADAEALSRRGEILESLPTDHDGFARREADRCLSCAAACLRCVELCPNRANVALPVGTGGPFAQSIQIVHVDELCNECGNCGFFCPYEGEPYRGKPTLFSCESDLSGSANAGFAFVGPAAEPVLILRSKPGPQEPVAVLSYEKWSPSVFSAAADPLSALAALVHRDHPYLIPGGRPC